MPGLSDVLRAAGIGTAVDDRPDVRTECARLARRLREARLRSIGLVPAGEDVAVPLLAVRLARALSDMSPSPVGVVDANGSWTCARELMDAAAIPDERPVATSWLHDNLAVLAPRAPEPGAVIHGLRELLFHHAAPFSHLVVDLTGLDRVGEQLAACQLLDAVAVVARSGRTCTRQIPRWYHRLAGGRGLGVLLTGL